MKRRNPGPYGSGLLQSAGRPAPSLVADGNTRANAAPTVNLAAIPDSYYRAWAAGYAEGIQYGYARALDDLDAAENAAWAELSARVRKQANSPRFAKLCDLRGEPEKAERARARERRNGLELAS